MDNRIKVIRESEKKSHIEMYSNDELYQPGSWLNRPIKTIKEIVPLFGEYRRLRVLDLGCGVGRNSIFEGWTVLKTTVQEQQYDIPRENGMCDLQTKVVSFVARKW